MAATPHSFAPIARPHAPDPRWLTGTAIERSVSATLTYASLGLACTVSAYLVPALFGGPFAFVAGVPLVLLAILFFVGAGHASWRAPCPRCAATIALPADDDVVAPCPGCAAQIEGRAGRARVVA